ncbi:MAG: pentapeptide repeat protein [Nocardioidaceae bacterium]|nr:pentapeptide repeat protein [Nocardioidaceae bacterium]
MSDPRAALRADCLSCVGLCCVVPAFGRSADFAIDKPAGVPCPNLGTDHLCTIHTELRDRGFPGCTVYDCFGAGQHVVQVLFSGADRSPEMEAAFEVVERLHELLWYLTDAAERSLPRGLADEVAGLTERVLVARDAPAAADVPALQGRVGVLLEEVSAVVRRGLGGPDHRHADLAGRDLRDTDLFAADLRGAVLIGADLRDVDLGPADLLGADVRGTDLRGADLDQALFVTRLQIAAARTE